MPCGFPPPAGGATVATMLIPPRQLSWVRSALATARAAGDTRVLVGPRTAYRSRGVVEGGGTLAVGGQWPSSPPLETHFVVTAGARVAVTGAFRFMSGCRVALSPGAVLRLGSGYMNNDCRLSIAHGLTLGDGVAIGPRVCFLDDDRHELAGAAPRGAPITVGDRVWIGMNALILKGVAIGDGAVIAAGSVVTRDVPPGTLAAGAPAMPKRAVEWR